MTPQGKGDNWHSGGPWSAGAPSCRVHFLLGSPGPRPAITARIPQVRPHLLLRLSTPDYRGCDGTDLSSGTRRTAGGTPVRRAARYSWNTVGSTQSPGPGGPTCTPEASAPDYCYNSCSCTDKPQCMWTTCDESVRLDSPPRRRPARAFCKSLRWKGSPEQREADWRSSPRLAPACRPVLSRAQVTPTGTGTKDVGGFIPGLYDTLESQLCVDVTRESAAWNPAAGGRTLETHAKEHYLKHPAHHPGCFWD